MFENESKEYARKNTSYYGTDDCYDTDTEKVEQVFKDAAAFGYNKAKEDADKMKSQFLELCNLKDMRIAQLEKANEWHFVKDGDLPEVDNRIVLCVCGDGYIDGKKHYILKLLTRKEFPLFQPVYAWKEIVLPELPKESKGE